MHALSQPPLHPGSDRQLSPGQQELRSLWGKTVLRQNVLLLDKGRQCWRKASKEGSHSSHPDFTGEAAKVGAAATVTYSGGKNQDNHRDTAYILAKEHPGCLGTSKKKKKKHQKPLLFQQLLIGCWLTAQNIWKMFGKKWAWERVNHFKIIQLRKGGECEFWTYAYWL